ncbi:MAG: tRNA 2-thiocytidine biosynthesis protein TtcA [Selenomonadaceae bacterium]|nr:tRNA 2-thiocytidine biosynthesis protein TtcA [Selenomonadaceae bacterium]
MKLTLPKHLFSKLVRAVVEFELISAGDKILIGVSGGKDSLFLTYALALLRQRFKIKFELAALTINPMFNNNFNVDSVNSFCKSLDIDHIVQEVDIAGVIASQQNKKPCFTCAYFRRAAVNRYANEIGANKVAYAHHHDDAVETFLMSLLSSGQINTFMPKTYLDRSNITVIRPLVYLREKEIIDFVRESNFNVVKSPCPIDGKTNRQTTKELIASLNKQFPGVFDHLSSAIRQNAVHELWQPPKTTAQMRETYFNYL